jgi:hypothetical protein
LIRYPSNAVVTVVIVIAGVGKQLLVAAFDWILNQGATKCSAFAQSQNAAARQLFESCGGLPVSSTHTFHFWLASRPPFNDFANSTIPNNKPYLGGDELQILKNLFESRAIQTRGKYTQECETRLEKELQADKVLHALSHMETCFLVPLIQQ